MTTLDTIARSSATAVHLSVSGVRVPLAGVAVAAQVAAMWRMAGYAVAGATVGAATVFVLLFTGAAPDDPTQNLVPTTNAVVPTTVPATPVPPTTASPVPTEEPPPVAVVPGDSGSESSPEPEPEPEPEPVPEPVPVDDEPPMLEVISPKDGERFESKVVTFSSVSVNGDGLWSVDLVLAPGANGVVFMATDAAGNESEVRLTVHLDVETPKETTTTTAAEWQFTANQQYGSCAEPLPYDVFSGKAKPGTIVTISSPHGGGTVVVDGNGKWSTRIDFPTAMYNVQFTVTIKDYTGAKKTFAFTSFYNG